MSSMVLTQLLNPESGVDRKNSGRAPESQVPGDDGPSRYDEIVRQQEKRLERQRVEDRARARDMEQERLAEKRRSGEARNEEPGVGGADTTRRKQSSETAKEDRPADPASGKDRPGQGKSTDSDKVADAENTRPDAERAVDAGASQDNRALESSRPAGEDAELLELVDGAEAPVILGPNGQLQAGVSGNARGASAPGLLAPGLVMGQQPGGAPTVGKLFAAMLENGKPASGKSGDLLPGLQNGSLQASTESAGKFADTLMARMSAPELTQSLNQSATLRGQEAQALMRSYSTSVDSPVGDNEWGEKVMGKLAWLTASQMSVAEIHITPPELGPLDVRVQVQNDQATVTVHATTPAVREQLELHGHRLRDMLSEQGLSLEGFDVSDSAGREAADQQAEGEADGQHGPGQVAGQVDGDDDADTVTSGALDLSWKGEVDLYA